MDDKLTVRRLGVALGAQVEGVELRAELDEEQRAALRGALDEHQVLFFKDQYLDEAEHIAALSVFGEPHGSEPFSSLGIEALSRTARLLVRNKDRGPSTESWHSDITYMAVPPVAGSISAVEMPPLGGDTVWVSTYSIFESLSEPMQELCEGLFGEHSWEPIRGLLGSLGPDVVERSEALFPPQLHPLVQTHPRTGRKHLYLSGPNAWMSRIVGLHQHEAQVLYDFLQRQLDNVEFQIRWQWSDGDLAVWEERSTNHKGMADHYKRHPDRTVRSVLAFADGR